jgi:hypothetical protein
MGRKIRSEKMAAGCGQVLAAAWAVRPQPRITATQYEILLGRLFAVWAHPVAAWRCCSRAGRVAVIAGYLAAGYVLTLAALRLLVPQA